jgi:hypothetical protein
MVTPLKKTGNERGVSSSPVSKKATGDIDKAVNLAKTSASTSPGQVLARTLTETTTDRNDLGARPPLVQGNDTGQLVSCRPIELAGQQG